MVISFCCITVSIFYGSRIGWFELIVAGVGYGFLALDAVIAGQRTRAIIFAIGATIVTALQILPLLSAPNAPVEVPTSRHVG